MKYAMFGLLGLVGGFLLGGVQPRREMGELREELTAMRDQLAASDRKASRCGPTLFPSMPGLDRLTRPDEPEPDVPDDGATADRVNPHRRPEVTVVGPDGTEASFDDPSQQFDLAVEAQRLRVEQTRAALREQADLDDAEMIRMDDIAARMNDRLAEHADDLMALAMSGEERSPRDLLAISHEVTGILYDSQVDLEQVVGPDRSQDVEEDALVVWNYIDLDVFRPAMEAAHSGVGKGPK